MRVSTVFLALAFGCASSRAPRVPVPPREPTPAVAHPWRIFAYPPADYARVKWVERGSDDTERFTLGGVRAEVNGNSIVFGRQGLLDQISMSCRSGSGWVHFTDEGRSFGSNTFLGSLTLLGTTWTSSLPQQCGPVAIMNHYYRDPELWSPTGSQPLRAARELSLFHFTSPLQVRAIAPPDHLLQSDDGGQSFYDSASQARDFNSPWAWLGTDLLITSKPAKRSMVARLKAAYVHRAVASEAGAEAAGFRLCDGTWVRFARDSWKDEKGTHDQKLISIRRPDGTVVDTALDENCRLYPWGDRVLAECARDDWRVIYPPGMPRIPKPPLTRSLMGPFFADPSGHYLVADAGPQDLDRNAERKLLMFDGSEWVVHEHVQGSPQAISEKWLVLCGGSCRLVPLWNPGAAGMLVSLEPKRVSAFSLLDDAILYVRKHRTREEPTVYSDEPVPNEDTELVYQQIGPKGLAAKAVHLIGKGTDWIAFADRFHGMAGTSKQASTTTDGGDTWTPIPDFTLRLGLLGHQPDDYRGVATCWRHGCALRGTIAFSDRPIDLPITVDFARTWPKPQELPPTRRVPQVDPDRILGDPLERVNTHYECKSHPTATLQALSPGLDSPPTQGSTTGSNEAMLRWSARGGLLEKLRNPPRFRWRGYDGQGAFSVTTLPLEGIDRELWQAIERQSTGRPFLMSRHFTIFGMDTRAVLGVEFLRDDGHTESFLPSNLPIDGLVLTDGTAVVQFRRESRAQRADGYLEAVALDAQGHVTSRRWFTEHPAVRSLSTYVAVGPAGPGIVLVETDALKYFTLEPGTAPWVFPIPRMIPDCVGSPKGDSVRFLGPPMTVILDRRRGIDISSPHWSVASVIIELSEGGACVRGIRSNEGFALTADAIGRTFRGKIVGPKSTYDVTCTRENTKEKVR